MSIYGGNLGPPDPMESSFDPETLLPTSMDGISVTIGGVPAPLYFVRADQINAQAPYEIAGKPNVELIITNNGKSSPPYKLAVGSAGVGFLPTILNSDGSINSPSNPAHAGEVVIAYATGQGITIPPSQTGAAAIGRYPSPVLPIAASIGGVSAEILYLRPGAIYSRSDAVEDSDFP